MKLSLQNKFNYYRVVYMNYIEPLEHLYRKRSL